MYNTSMCYVAEGMQVRLFEFKKPLSWVTTLIAWAMVYAQPLYRLYQRLSLSPHDVRIVTQLLFEVMRFILLPLFYAYIWRPVNKPHITVQVPSTDRETMTSDDLDVIDKSILHSLLRNPSGCTTRMIHQRIGPMYPELERKDIDKRLEALTANNRAAILPTTLSSIMWIPIKVKSQ